MSAKNNMPNNWCCVKFQNNRFEINKVIQTMNHIFFGMFIIGSREERSEQMGCWPSLVYVRSHSYVGVVLNVHS